jgi:hypothetical protein
MVDRNGYEHKMPVIDKNIYRDGPMYVLKNLREMLWCQQHKYDFNLAPPGKDLLDKTNTRVVDFHCEV